MEFLLLFFFIPFATSPAVISGAIALAIWIFSGVAFYAFTLGRTSLDK